MTDDRTLLEKAARAAGIVGEVAFDREGVLGVQISGSNFWRPLDDDGDALRLLVTISLKKGHRLMLPEPGDPWAVVDDYSWGKKARDCDADPYAATRRAIVRAAASQSPPDAAGKNQGEQG